MLAYHKYHSKSIPQLAVLFETTEDKQEIFDIHDEMCRRIGTEKANEIIKRTRKVLRMVS